MTLQPSHNYRPELNVTSQNASAIAEQHPGNGGF